MRLIAVEEACAIAQVAARFPVGLRFAGEPGFA